jgi:3-hydroxyisobutyrate dehydrogenase-like beta-hydroxyacid dehydrogenase
MVAFLLVSLRSASSEHDLINRRPIVPAAGFFVAHFVKDLGIALNECQRMGLSLPGLALVRGSLFLAFLSTTCEEEICPKLYPFLSFKTLKSKNR